jgi:hypothetical protein
MRSMRATNRIEFDNNAEMSLRSSDTQTALQYLIWALEQIEKTGNQKAVRHARLAIEALRQNGPAAAKDIHGVKG